MSQQDGIKFLHFRKRGANGEVASRGGLTIAYLDQEGRRFCAVAQCSEQDNFCKARGRELASNRLSSPVFARGASPNDDEFMAEATAVASVLGYERKFSGKRKRVVAKKAAKKATKKVVAKQIESK